MEGHLETTITAPFPGLPTEMVFKILGNLDNHSLLSCRLVSKGWCKASSILLQNRPNVIVQSWGSSQYKCGRLVSLIECFKRSREFNHTFPYSNFFFVVEMSNNNPDLELFFTLSKPPSSGLNVRCLRFDVIGPCNNNLKRIFDGTPDLRILCLCFYHNFQFTTDLDAPSPGHNYSEVTEGKLSSLKILQLNNCDEAAVPLVTSILKAAPNLQRIEGTDISRFKGATYHVYELGHLKVLADTKKLNLINDCMLVLKEQIVVSGLLVREKLSGFQPTFLNLELPEFSTDPTSAWVRNRELNKSALNEVLWTVKESVEELTTNNCLGLLDKRTLPRFSKLRRLVWDRNLENTLMFPAGIRRRDVFPKLEEIRLRAPYCMDEAGLFPDLSHIPEIPSVYSLTIWSLRAIKKTFMESMALMCPNLRCLELSFSYIKWRDFIWFGPFIWENMRGLKIIALDIKYLRRMNSLEKMEAGFTGFSLDTVRQLEAAAPEDWPRLEEVEHLRINPSILNMTELEKLVINLSLEDLEGQVPALPLSSKYAFDLMPRLTVDISSTHFTSFPDSQLLLISDTDSD